LNLSIRTTGSPAFSTILPGAVSFAAFTGSIALVAAVSAVGFAGSTAFGVFFVGCGGAVETLLSFAGLAQPAINIAAKRTLITGNLLKIFPEPIVFLLKKIIQG
jgi:subtilisin family serine protease